MMQEDDSSVDTTGAVSEHPDNNKSRDQHSPSIPFLAPAGGRTTTTNHDGRVKIELDDKPVYRRMGTRSCRVPGCPNFLEKCMDHGVTRKTCMVKQCINFSQVAGFCGEHEHLAPLSPDDKPKKKKRAANIGGDASVQSKKKRKNKHGKKSVDTEVPVDPSMLKSPPKRGKMRDDIVLSMRDKDYESFMHKQFREMEVSNDKVADVAKKIVWAFKSRLSMSPGCLLLKKIDKDSYVEVGEEEALKMIKAHLHNRNQSSKSWRVGMPDTKIAAYEQPAPKKKKAKQVNEGLVSPSTKKQKTGNKQDNKNSHVIASSSTRRSRTRPSFAAPHAAVGKASKDSPLSWIGNYIANCLTAEKVGWQNKQEKVDKINFGPVIYMPGFDRKTAVEGVNKWVGYEALARWAYKSGYYKEYVVNTSNGKALLKRANVTHPYSIFGDDTEDEKPAAAVVQYPVQAEQPLIQQARGRVSPPARIKDDATPVSNDGKRNMLSFNCSSVNQEYWQIHESIDTKFDAATEENDEESVGFYRYLLSYLDGKATRGEFSLAPAEKDNIIKAVESFEAAQDKYKKAILANKPADAYKFWMVQIIDGCKQKLPLA